MKRRDLVFVGLALALAGCATKGWDEPVAADVVAIDRQRVVIRSGPIGAGEWLRQASYVLVAAKNQGDRDLVVTLRGHLIEGDQRHELLPESLRVPAGGERLFALVDRGQVERPGATAADVVVSGALAVRYAPAIKVSDGKVYPDQGRAVVVARIENTGKTEAKVPVIAAFYDADGAPMERPFTVVVLAGGGARGVQLVGPPGSATAQMFVGEAQF